MKPGLKPALDHLVEQFERATHVADPVRVLSRYPRREDREIAAFLAAGLAFGRVQSVLQSVEFVLGTLGPKPATYVRAFEPVRDGADLRSFVHRWTRGDDLIDLLLVLQRMLAEEGSIEAFFARGCDEGAADVREAMESFSSRACAIAREVSPRPRRAHGVSYFFPRPSAGSACKRLNLFLRWMVRQDRIDPGGWLQVLPAQLVVPLDVHVIRVGRCLGLTTVKSAGWTMAADITATLRTIDPTDPVKYDFALCHLGMLGQCHFGETVVPSSCPLAGFCRPKRRS